MNRSIPKKSRKAKNLRLINEVLISEEVKFEVDK